MNDMQFGFGINVVPLLEPKDIAATATATPWVNLKGSVNATFELLFGSITAASADQAITVTVEAATAAASGSEVKVAFKYRLSGAVGANTMGAITDATAAAGASIGTTDDNKVVLIELDLNGLDAALADASHARVVITPDAGGTATLTCAQAFLQPRYAGLTQASAT